MRKPFRLAVDLGSTSLGWAVIDLNGVGRPCGYRTGGVHLFSDSRDKQRKTKTLAAGRREQRQMRRRRERLNRRKRKLAYVLIEHGLLPERAKDRDALLKSDPYRLRAEGLDRPLHPHELGRALVHINQRRGYRGARNDDKNEKSAIDQGINALRQGISEDESNDKPRTFGEWLYRRDKAGQPVRARPEATDKQGQKVAYPFYPSRHLISAEFELLWDAQAAFNPDLLTGQLKARIRHVIFTQRPLKPVQPGRCRFLPEERRAPKAHRLFQRFRLLSELANLSVYESDLSQRPLTLAERDRIVARAFGERGGKPRDTISFKEMRKELGRPDIGFSHETQRRTSFYGDRLGAKIAKHWGARAWRDMDADRRDNVIALLRDGTDEEEVVADLVTSHGLAEDTARKLSRESLEWGYGDLSEAALRQLVPILETGEEPVGKTGATRPITYAEACAKLDWHHSDQRDGILFDRLPYYGEVLPADVVDAPATADGDARAHGWIANPTVHVALNQLRRVVNAVIDAYGHPSEIVVETTRDLKKSPRQRAEEERRNRKNAQQRERDARWIEETLGKGQASQRDLFKLRLWREMPEGARQCVITGESLESPERVLSRAVEIEHILPRSRSLDDSASNKILMIREANRVKASRTPAEAFTETPSGYTWDDSWPAIMRRVHESLPAEKARRFRPEHSAATGEFLDNQLNDTAYMSRLARRYLTAVCNPNRVWGVPGRLTALLRAHWGLDQALAGHNAEAADADGAKSRGDHRHHAIDALIAGLTDRAMVKRVAEAQARQEAGDRAAAAIPPPWPDFDPAEIRQRLRKMPVSHKPARTAQGQILEETAFRPLAAGDAAQVQGGEVRIPVRDLKEKDLAEPGETAARYVKDPGLRARLRRAWAEASHREPAERAKHLQNRAGAAKVKLIEPAKTLVALPHERADPAGKRHYKALPPGRNFCFRIFRNPRGRWQGETVSLYQAYRWRAAGLDPKEQARAGAALILFAGDLILVDDGQQPNLGDGRQRLLRVVKMTVGKLGAVDHHRADGGIKEGIGEERSASWYVARKLRPAWVDGRGKLRAGAPIHRGGP